MSWQKGSKDMDAGVCIHHVLHGFRFDLAEEERKDKKDRYTDTSTEKLRPNELHAL